jgi:hypothetical protein
LEAPLNLFIHPILELLEILLKDIFLEEVLQAQSPGTGCGVNNTTLFGGGGFAKQHTASPLSSTF